jgi:hypothetical protein
MNSRLFTLMIGTLIFLVPLTSKATAGTASGLFRIHLDTTVFRVGIGEIDPDDSPANDYDGFTGGIGLESAGIGFGYTVINGLVIGGKLSFGADGFDKYHSDVTGFRWSIMPYVEYIFLDGLLRPFVIGIFGFQGRNNLPQTDDYWDWAFTFSAGGGLHIFVFNNLSFDGTMLFGFDVGAGEYEFGTPRGDVHFNHWKFKLDLLLGMSVWF